MKQRYGCIMGVGLILGIGASSCRTSQSHLRSQLESGAIDIQTSGDEKSTIYALHSSSSYDSIIMSYQDKVEKTPSDVASWNRLASLYLASGQLDKSESAAKSALRWDIKNQPSLLILGQVAIRRGQTRLAEIILNGFVDKKNSGYLNLMGLIALKNNQQSLALAYFKEALAQNANDVAVRMNIGVSYFKYRQLQEAAVQFERVVQIQPDHVDAKLHLGMVRAAQGQHDEAAELYSYALKKSRDNPAALYNLAVLERKRERYSQATDLIKRFLKTSYARTSNSKPAFDLLEDIRVAQEQSGGSAISDSEIASLSQEVGKKNSYGDEVKNETWEPVSDVGVGVDQSPSYYQDPELKDLEEALAH